MTRLLIHGTGHGKKTSRRLPELKILIVRESGGNGHILSVIFIADFQRLEDVFRSFAFGGEVLDEGIVMRVDRLTSRSMILTLREVLTKRHCIPKARLRL